MPKSLSLNNPRKHDKTLGRYVVCQIDAILEVELEETRVVTYFMTDLFSIGIKMNRVNLDGVVHYKVFLCAAGYEPEVRRMTVDKDICHNYIYLKQKLINIFPVLKETQFTISWKDLEGDTVRICSDEELVIALKEMEGQERKKIFVSTTPEEVEGPIHPNVFCDQCETLIQGFRYKCIVCSDFDLCPDCERSQSHPEHPMLRIPIPLSQDYPFSKRFGRDLHKISKQIDQLLRQEKRGSENKGRGDGNCGNTSESKSSSSKKHERKHKHCPFNAHIHHIPDTLKAVFEYMHIPEHACPEAGERPQPTSNPEEATPNTSAQAPSNMDDHKKFVEMIRRGLTTFLNPLGDDTLYHSMNAHDEPSTAPQDPSSSSENIREESKSSSGQHQSSPQVPPTGNDTRDAGAGGDSGMAASVSSNQENVTSSQRETTHVLDSTWTVVNSQEDVPTILGRLTPIHPNIATASTESSEQQKPTSLIYPAIPVMPITPTGQNVIDETMNRMLAMGFSDEGGWLRQLVENKKGNIEEVLMFLSPIPKPQPPNK